MYVRYPSSLDDDLRLFAKITLPDKPAPIRLQMHGWHGQVKTGHSDNVAVAKQAKTDFLLVEPEMRGRGDSSGKPDCNGLELIDAVDAVEFVRREYAGYVSEPENVYLSGGSGGGGNVFALLGKFPDYFCRARADCGMSDYAMWYENDRKGEFRDELETAGWIGGNPDNNRMAYQSRSGIVTAGNLLTPLIVFHGEKDIRVPAEHSRRFVEEVYRRGKHALVSYFELPGAGGMDHWTGITPEQAAFKTAAGELFMHLPSAPPVLPERGSMTVAGYLRTSRFEVYLESIDLVADLSYDLTRHEIELFNYGTREKHSRPARIVWKA